jgi:hypothetical protein
MNHYFRGNAGMPNILAFGKSRTGIKKNNDNRTGLVPELGDIVRHFLLSGTGLS